MKMSRSLLSLIALLGFTTTASAADANIVWKPMNQYTDVEPTASSEDVFHRNMKRAFERQAQSSAEEHLPEGFTLKLVMRDIDLTGIVGQGRNGSDDPASPGGSTKTTMKMVRIKGENHPAIILLDYFIYNDKRQIVAKGTKRLTDNDLRYKKRHSVPFHLERKLLRRWINKLGKTV